MGDKTHIEWTDATWNPTTGCDRVSPGCDHCYALDMAKRLKAMGSKGYQNDGDARTSGPGFALTMHPDRLDQPLRWKKPRKIFVNSMSDLFHPDVSDEFIYSVFSAMLRTRRHTYQVLTKRPQRMTSWLANWGPFSEGGPDGPDLKHIWLGTSIESNRYSFRADHLRAAPGAVVRFLSCEPLLGPLPNLNLEGIDWVIVGGESGPKARPMDERWVRDIRDRCVDADVAFLFKQWGEWAPVGPHRLGFFPKTPVTLDPDTHTWRLGRKEAGRELDGRTWDEYPDGG